MILNSNCIKLPFCSGESKRYVQELFQLKTIKYRAFDMKKNTKIINQDTKSLSRNLRGFISLNSLLNVKITMCVLNSLKISLKFIP